MKEIRNIYCVGRNYVLHAKEMNSKVTATPFLFAKPTHALVTTDGGDVVLPGNRGEVHHELEVVVHIAKDYQVGMKVDEIVDEMALGIDFTLRDVQSELKQKGLPWLIAKGFKNSGLLTGFQAFPGTAAAEEVTFSLLKNAETVQHGQLKEMIFNLQTIIDFCGEHFGLAKGDIIYTGTPAGVGPVTTGDRLALKWGEETLGACTIRLQ
jgi:fumarylpyruvate hydrolase